MGNSKDAQIKASSRYNKLHTTQYCIRLNYKTDSKIIDKLQSVPSKRKYILDLIRADLQKQI